MHGYAKKGLLVLALACWQGQANAQEPAPAAPEPAAPAAEQPEQPERRPPSGGLPLPSGDTANIPINTVERFSVAPYKLYGLPRSTREEIATVTIVRPPGETPTQLADSFTMTTFELVGATSIVLPLVKEGEAPFERRIEFLVIDSISTAYKSYLEATIRRMFPTAKVDILVANNQTAVLNGFVDKAELVQPIEDLVRGFLAAGAGAAPDSVSVVNALRVTGVQQVQLQVIIAEVNRQKTRDLGFDWSWLDLNPNGLRGAIANSTGGFIGANQLFTPPTGTTPGTVNIINPNLNGANFPFVAWRDNNFAFWGFLRALVTNNMAKILAEPNLVALSGQPAYFNVGGETPILIPQGNGTISIQYRPFGTNLRFVPTVLGEGRIRLEIRPEVSEIDPALQVTLQGISVPGFRSRTAETTVELENGQTFAVAGLVQQRIQATTAKTPILGDLPLVGWSWQNKRYQQLDTELLIMVTPHLAEAMNERPCKLPGRESRIPNDVEWFLGSRFEPPCFTDPYRNHYKNHHAGVKPPRPEPVAPYDNWGKPQYEQIPIESPALVPTETAPAPAAPAPQTPAPTTFSTPPASQGIPPLDEVSLYDDGVVPPPPPVMTKNQAAKIVSVQSSQVETVDESGAPSPTGQDEGWVRAGRRRGGGIRQAMSGDDSQRR
ncbi:MAG: hypothetical protein U1D30_18200 [Planctomycetota bacterium]